MRLKHIKLVGFKSFVDATKVPFPEQMTCVVGPNGCGKSNVIDAVRWVLGESSAKNLRGDAMTDVIFNGSSSRKPVSQASVELVFDNSSGRIQGEYASYNEISVKRLVTREGQSTYFLNGTKCRRRDITDLFLGTGLGPRSYAIIEQGMISRLIESRPQELRVFIEEAAGISKYKERRRDTENRMNRTRDNLERLTDVREELGTQLAKLQRQAAAARRYKELKAEERTLKAQLQALKWLHYQQQCDRVETQLRKDETELERWISEQRGSERGQDELRQRQAQLKAELDSAQHSFYQVNNEITRLEQKIQHQRLLAEKRQRDEKEYRHESHRLDSLLQEEAEELSLISTQRTELAPTLEQAGEKLEQMQQRLLDAELAYEQWQQADQVSRQLDASLEQKQSLLSAEEQGVAALRASIQQQLEQARRQLDELAPNKLTLQRDELTTEVQEKRQKLESLKTEYAKKEASREATERQLNAVQNTLSDLQNNHQQLTGRIASLQQLLESAQRPLADEAHAWIANKPHVATLLEMLEVEDDWKLAVETVTGPWLQSPVLTDSNAGWPEQAGLGRLLMCKNTQQPPPDSLASFVKGPARHLSLLHTVQVAETLADAEAKVSSGLAPHVVLRDGRQVGVDWLIGDTKTVEDSQLSWRERLEALQQEQGAVGDSLHKASTERDNLTEQLKLGRESERNYQSQLTEVQQQVASLQARLESLQREIEQQQARRTELETSRENLEMDLAEHQERLLLIEEQRQSIQQQLEEGAPERAERDQQGGHKREAVQIARTQLEHAQTSYHDLRMQMQQLTSSEQHLAQTQQRTAQQLAQLKEKINALQHEPGMDDDENYQEDLAIALERRAEAEAVKNDAADALAGLEQELAVLAQGQQGVTERINQQRQKVEASKLELAAARERGHSLLEGLQESGNNLKQVLENLPEDADESVWQQRLDKIARSLQQLGAINLAAIEEADIQAERKAYLDNQYDDLQSSLQLLEDAIKKIDKETRQRFRKTFDQVNSDLSALFPKVFGGGSAYLALTDEDLLETGVTIMARPPGKKNSTIHLLSGGEKALTALSLVFAIFRLNPAPFCLLDEVDAPLDDANVGRFCRLVQEMSESVQFIYISHNKIAMEMASHLAGVTMQEPGVSRLVAVDVDEAVAMAEAS